MENNGKKMKFADMATFFVAGAVAMLLLSRHMRKKTGNWADQMRQELMDRVKKTKDITQEKYNQIIDEIRPRYETVKDLSVREIGDFASELKSHWQNISQEVKKQIKTGSKETKEAATAE